MSNYLCQYSHPLSLVSLSEIMNVVREAAMTALRKGEEVVSVECFSSALLVVLPALDQPQLVKYAAWRPGLSV